MMDEPKDGMLDEWFDEMEAERRSPMKALVIVAGCVLGAFILAIIYFILIFAINGGDG